MNTGLMLPILLSRDTVIGVEIGVTDCKYHLMFEGGCSSLGGPVSGTEISADEIARLSALANSSLHEQMRDRGVHPAA